MKLLFTGDYCPAEINFNKFTIDPNLLDLLSSADAVFGNLECPITSVSASKPGQSISLKAEPEINPLTEGFTALSIANNHILDYGETGAQETINFLNQHRISSFGFGRTPEEAARPCRLQINGMALALFGITQWYTGGIHRSGTCSDRNRFLFRNIKQCRDNGDFVIVMPHWNYELSDFPAPSTRRLARKLVNCGTCLIAGAHPHVVNGVESFRNKTVAYSLGNFLFSHQIVFRSGRNDPRLRTSFILECSIEENLPEYSISIHPVHFTDNSIELLTGRVKEECLSRLKHLNSFFKSDSTLKKVFYKQAPLIVNRTSSVMKSMISRQGLRTILSRLHKIRMQDIMVSIHSLIKRNK
jgi:Bacterial capsule synthesis protein PGA_cap